MREVLNLSVCESTGSDNEEMFYVNTITEDKKLRERVFIPRGLESADVENCSRRPFRYRNVQTASSRGDVLARHERGRGGHSTPLCSMRLARSPPTSPAPPTTSCAFFALE
ncbi:hypothetical protein ACJJTC_002184 [Scirpophaga incertulas]